MECLLLRYQDSPKPSMKPNEIVHKTKKTKDKNPRTPNQMQQRWVSNASVACQEAINIRLHGPQSQVYQQGRGLGEPGGVNMASFNGIVVNNSYQS